LSAAPPRSLLSVAFGDFAGEVWGVAWSQPEPMLLLHLGGEDVSESIELRTPDGAADASAWRLLGPRVELLVEAAGPAVGLGEAEGDGGFEQLSRVRGTATVDGGRSIDCLGRRTLRSQLEPREYDSIRDVSAWFEPDEGLALVSLRPRKARGQSSDDVTAAVLDKSAPRPVAEARLSTTYDERGAPVRAGFELWLEEDDAEQYPRRAAGEAIGRGSRTTVGALDVLAEPLRWHSRGRDGVGVYLLARPQ
jgi:hypothetical protein